MMKRVNMTTKPDTEWRHDLALSFRKAAEAASSPSIKEWYEREAASIEEQDA